MSSSTELYLYQYTCDNETGNPYKEEWRNSEDTVPSHCITDSSHTISNIHIVDTMTNDTVKIDENDSGTGGSYCAETKNMVIPANSTETFDYTYPFPVSVLSIEFHVKNQQNDEVELHVAPDTTIGMITSPVSIGDTVINVSSTVIQYTKKGYYIKLFDGTNMNDLGRVVNIDIDNDTITLENAATYSFALTPTYIVQTIKMIPHLVIGPDGRYMIGESKIGGSILPTDTVIRVVYKNTSDVEHSFYPMIEYLY